MKDIEKEDLIQWLIDIVPHTTVSYHHPGEMKIKLMLSGLPLINRIDLNALQQSIPGILGVKTNLFSRSLTITNNQDELPFSIFEDLLKLKGHPENESRVSDSLKKVLGVA
jgi:hypothetical protein